MTEAQKIRLGRYKLAYAALMAVYPFGLEDLEGEIWRWIRGYEELYQVSNYGRIKSFHNGKVKILKPILQWTGYLLIDLHKNGRHRLCRLHVIVAQTFLPNPINKPEVDHKFGNKLDCSAENLEWVTSAENHKRAAKIGLKKCGENNPNAKLTNELANWCREVYVPRDKEFGVRALARKLGVNHKTISWIIQGKLYKNN